MQSFLLIVLMLFSAAQAFAQGEAEELKVPSRFRPWIEAPAFYALTEKERLFWNAAALEYIHVTRAMSAAYESMEDQNFDQRSLIHVLVEESAKQISECRKTDTTFPMCREPAARLSLMLLRDDNRIDDVGVRIILNAIRARDEKGSGPTTSLQKYWNKLREIGDLKPIPLTNNPYQNRIFSTKIDHELMTARQRLYMNFTYLEIDAMSYLYDTFFKRTNGSMDLVMDFNRDGTEDDRVSLSPGEVEVKSLELLERIKERARSGNLKENSERDARRPLINLKFSNTDLIMAGVETGRINVNVLNEISKTVELNDPRHQGRKKVLAIGKRVLTAAFLANPLLSGFSSLALIVYQTYEEVRNEKNKTSSDHLK